MEKSFVQNMLGLVGIDAEREKPGDYIGEDGLLYCGKCHTPKQVRRYIAYANIGEKILPITCKCQEEAYAEQQRRRKDEEDKARLDELRKASLMDERSKKSTFDAFRETESNHDLLVIARTYAEEFDRMVAENQGLIFYGQPGTGKTFAAACIVNYLLDRKVPVLMTSFVKLMDQFMRFREYDSEDVIYRINSARLLVIDDLGAERGTDYALERVYDVIDSRYRANKPLILTSNLTIGEMQAETNVRLKRIYDRVFEICYPVQVKGASWRQKQAADRYDKMSQLFKRKDGR